MAETYTRDYRPTSREAAVKTARDAQRALGKEGGRLSEKTITAAYGGFRAASERLQREDKR